MEIETRVTTPLNPPHPPFAKGGEEEGLHGKMEIEVSGVKPAAISTVAAAFLFLTSLLVYLLTLCPTVHLEDSGQFTLAAHVLGLPQPTGYPLFSLLGKIFTYLPVGDVAFRVNFFNALLSALTAGLSYFLAQTIFPEKRFKLVHAGAPLLLAFSYSLWMNTVYTKIYTLHYLFATLLLTVFFKLLKRPHEIRYFLLLSFLLGLSLANHFTTWFLVPFLCAYLLKKPFMKNAAMLSSAFFLFALSYSINLFLPLRAAAEPVLNWGDPHTFRQFVYEVTKSEWAAEYLGYTSFYVTVIKYGLAVYFPLIQLTTLGTALAVCAFYKIREESPDFFWFTLSFYLGSALVLPLLANPPKHEFLKGDFLIIPFYVLYSIWTARGILLIAERFLTPKRHALFLAVAAMIPFFMHFSDINKNNSRDVHEYGTKALSMLPPKALLITENVNQGFVLWYLQGAEGIRPDVAVVPMDFLNFAWCQRSLEQKGILIPHEARAVSSPFYKHEHASKESTQAAEGIIKANKLKTAVYINHDGGGRLARRKRLRFFIEFNRPPKNPNIKRVF